MSNKKITIKDLTDDDEMNALGDLIFNSNVDVAEENDGIGPYEFWGQRGNDKGTDFLIIDDEDVFSISTKASNKSVEDIVKILRDSLPDSRTIKQGGDDYHDGLSLELKLAIDKPKIEDDTFTCEITWEDTSIF
jgi:hypothetical protein